MKIFLHEIKETETLLDFTQDESWVNEAVARLDERIEGEPAHSQSLAQARAIEANFEIRQVDEVVVISGSIHTHIQLICSRCACPYPFKARPHFSALFCKDPVMAGIAHLARNPDDRNAPLIPMGQNKGHARHAHDSANDAAVESGMDLDITYISDDFINLADVLTEQLQLQIPFQPLCKEDCKGICPQCGADLNVGRCACAKLATARPFSVLQDFKVSN